MLLIEVYKNNFYLIVIIQIIIKVIINMDNLLDFTLLIRYNQCIRTLATRYYKLTPLCSQADWPRNIHDHPLNSCSLLNLWQVHAWALPIVQGQHFQMNTNTRFQYYQNMRKLHPDAYWSPKVQHQMHEDQKLMGDLFFDQLELPLFEEQL